MQESKKTNYDVVVLCGSPHKEGNTVAILQLLFKELSNITKTIHFAYELHVHPCIDCGFCHNEFGCIFHDDMDMLYATIKQSTLLIVASPLYFRIFLHLLKQLSTAARFSGNTIRIIHHKQNDMQWLY